MTFTLTSRRFLGPVAAAIALLAATFVLAIPGSAAAGQPAICAQYPDLPQCEEDDAGGGGNENENDGDGDGDDPVGGGGGTGNADGGDLPFTGYPLTPLLALLLALLVAGMAIRAYLIVRDRLRVDSAVDSHFGDL